ncbi:MAG: arginine--tRNA ligase [Sphaerochaetaceae bacterium]|nr:arginine--tRNA ligase [Sphaerochaetaceae bacterium]
MMQQIRETWKTIVEQELIAYATEKLESGDAIREAGPLIVQKPPKSEMGDLAFPLFIYAKVLRTAPQKIAEILRDRLSGRQDLPAGELLAAGPYLNDRVDLDALAQQLYAVVSKQGDSYGTNSSLSQKRIMVEFSCPNTNKPLHLGHLRNDAIGESVSAILTANGAQVHKVNLINNRGVHICKSMLAYQKFGNGETPQSSGMKGDHLVGKYYVKFSQWEKEDPSATEQAQEMLMQWEQGNPEVLALWKQMNQWTLEGLAQTYANTGISFDAYYYESETYMLGKDTVMQGLEKGVFYQEEDGSIWIDLTPINLDKKVLLRKDGTSLYITQDIGTAISRHADWPFDSLIYVVASEQMYHFKVLFYILKQLGYSWAADLHHLSYGMVNLPDGKMKSREGTVVDADNLFDELTQMAMNEIKEKDREDEIKDVGATSKAIALGALNYYLLQVNPTKDMVFNPAESISFNGNTGPYLQYMGARISSMMRKFAAVQDEYENILFDSSLLALHEERELVKLIAVFGEAIEEAGRNLNPAIISSYLYDLSRLFSKYYHDYPILRAETPPLVKARVTLVTMVLQVLRNAYALVGIPFLETM